MMKRCFDRILCGIMMIMLLFGGGCSPKAEDTLSFTAMDTMMSLRIWGGKNSCARIRDRAEELDHRLSTADENSEIFALNRDGTARLSADTAALVERSLGLCRALDGSFDITVYPAVRAWGFTAGAYTVPDDAALAALAEKIDYTGVRMTGDTVALPEGVMLDLGAAAKGYLADEAKAILRDAGASGAVLSLGGTILLYGAKPSGEPFTVGIADPDSPASYFGTLTLGEGVVATSGGYERYFERDGVRYIHILDPSTARPVDNGVLSVTIFADDGVRADALSTALFVMGVERASQYYRDHGDFGFAALTDGGELYITDNLAGSFTLNDGYSFTIRTVRKG